MLATLQCGGSTAPAQHGRTSRPSIFQLSGSLLLRNLRLEQACSCKFSATAARAHLSWSLLGTMADENASPDLYAALGLARTASDTEVSARR